LFKTARGTFISLVISAMFFTLTLLAGLGVQRAIETSGADLLGGDVEVRMVHRSVPEEQFSSIDGVSGTARMTSLRSMVEVGSDRRLVQVTGY
jgi:hypothetical protein